MCEEVKRRFTIKAKRDVIGEARSEWFSMAIDGFTTPTAMAYAEQKMLPKGWVVREWMCWGKFHYIAAIFSGHLPTNDEPHRLPDGYLYAIEGQVTFPEEEQYYETLD